LPSILVKKRKIQDTIQKYERLSDGLMVKFFSKQPIEKAEKSYQD
jgi:hypothetical protein